MKTVGWITCRSIVLLLTLIVAASASAQEVPDLELGFLEVTTYPEPSAREGIMMLPHYEALTCVNGPMTVAMWLRPWSYPESGSSSRVLSKYNHMLPDDAGRGYEVVMDDGGRISFRVNSDYPESNRDITLESKKAVPVGEWVHVSGVVDVQTGFIRLYLDGKLDAERRINRERIRANPEVNLYLGRYSGADALRYEGDLDELVIACAVLDLAELMRAPHRPDGNTVAYFNFDSVADLQGMVPNRASPENYGRLWDGRTEVLVESMEGFGRALAIGGERKLNFERSALEADFVLPAYVNRSEAALVVFMRPSEQRERDAKLMVSFRERDSGQAPHAPMTMEATLGKKAVLRIPIEDWPDGEYLTEIRDIASGDEIIRVLRKQTIAEPEAPAEPIDVRGINMLFVDDWYLMEREGLSVRLNPADLHPITEGPLEKDRIVQRGTRLRLEDDGTFAAYFWDADRRHENRRNHIARSADGINWRITPDHPPGRGASANNPSPRPERRDRGDGRQRRPLARRGGRSNLQTLPAAAPSSAQERSYRYYDPETDGAVDLNKVRARFVRNSTRWGDIEIPSRSVWPVWEKSPEEFVLLLRHPLVRDVGGNFHTGALGEWNDSNDNWLGQWMSSDGKTLHYAQARQIPRHPPFRIPYDNLWSANRIMVVWSTNDGLEWTPTYFSMPTEKDPVGYQHYGGRVFQVEGGNLLLAYVSVYNQYTQQMYFELNYSRDGIRWHRFHDQPAFAANGLFGSWNFGHLLGTGNSVVKDGRVYQYLTYNSIHPHFYGDFIYRRYDQATAENLRRSLEPKGIRKWPYWHHLGSFEAMAEDMRRASETLGLMTYRKEGWVSLTPDDGQGRLTTKVLRHGGRLGINAKTEAGGSVRVEVLDENGAPIPAYSGAAAAVFSGDSVDHRLAWGGSNVRELPGGPLRLRITLDRAELFALNW